MINEQIASNIATMRTIIKGNEELYVYAARLDPLIKTLKRFCKIKTMILSCQILVCVKVDKLADIEPVLGYLQDELGIEFDKSQDNAEQAWRQFECKDAKWLRVDAELIADGPECRRVIVGYETVPKYELKCGEDAQMPDALVPGGAA